MFQLSVISDLISIPSSAFNVPVRKAVLNELNIKYANKVIHKLGLVVTVWDVLSIDDGMLQPGDGASYIKVEFRCVVWKPFVGEVLSGWIEKCTPEGIKVKLEFFNDIFIPKAYLFENCSYSEQENAWIWTPEEGTNLYLDVNEKINFRIEEEIFTNIKPTGPNNELTNDKKEESDNDGDEENKGRVPPYAIIASCQTDGMGCVNWWD